MDLGVEIAMIALALFAIVFWKDRKEERFLSLVMTNEMKGLAILLIFAVHAATQPTVFFEFGGYGVGVFLLLSGYGLFMSDKLTNANPSSFLLKRLKRIFPAFALYLCISAFAWIMAPSIARSILGGHQPTDIISFIYSTFAFSHLWYIAFLVFWYGAYAFLLGQKIPVNLKIGLLWLCGFALIALRPFETGDPLRMLHEWFVYVLCFPFGVLLAHKHKEVEELLHGTWLGQRTVQALLCAGVFLIVGLVYLFSQTLANKSIHYPVTSLLFAGGTVLVWGFFLKNHRSGLLACLGNLSYEMYLFHSLVIIIVHQALEGIMGANEPVVFLASFGGSAIAAWLAKKIVEKISAGTQNI